MATDGQPPRRRRMGTTTQPVRQTHSATLTASRSPLPIHDSMEEETLFTRTFQEGQYPAHVRVAAGVTISMGAFQSLRIDCEVTMPCLPSEVDEAFAEVSELVAAKLSEEEDKWMEARG